MNMRANNFGQTDNTKPAAGIIELAAAQSQLDMIKSQHTRNGKVRMCIIQTGQPGLISSISQNKLVSFEMEGSGEVIEIDYEKLELCH